MIRRNKMRAAFKIITLLAAILLFTSCSHSPEASPLPQSAQPMQSTQLATALVENTANPIEEQQTAAPGPTPASIPVPLPTANIISGLPDPSSWAASLHFDPKDYPRVDGSTANIPLGIYVRAKVTGETLADSASATQFTTTGPAWQALAGGKADLLLVYEAPDEIKQQIDLSKLTIKPIGLDALVFLTNTGNPVTTLTNQQLIDIYTGKTTNWKQVGGLNTPIIPYQRISNSGSQALMLKLVMKDAKLMDVPTILQPAEMGGLLDALASYANTSNALGYSVYYYVRNMYQVPNVKLLSINGVAPTSDTIASGAYPYVNPFYAVIRADEPAGSPAHKLFDWLTGVEGKRAAKDAGYVPAK
jgi:phosphate transport system substrate-binding protein